MAKSSVAPLLAVLFCFVCGQTPLWAQPSEAGRPFLRNFSPKEYREDAQNWGAVQDRRGSLYFANNNGVVIYNGQQQWQRIPVAGRKVRGIAINDRGSIYVGAEGEFGVLRPTAAGTYFFSSLRDDLPDSLQNFQNVWQIHTSDQYVYLNLGTHLVRYAETDAGTDIRVWRTRDGSDAFHTFFVVAGIPYVREIGVGLQRIIDGRLTPVPGGELFAGERLDAIVRYDEDRVLLGTRKLGLLILGPEGFMPFPSPAAAFLDTAQVYHGTALPGGLFAFATLRGGVIVINRAGAIAQIINTETGLLDNNVHYLLPDRQGSLWLALDKGLAHVELPSPFTRFGQEAGLLGNVYSMARHRGTLYAGTSVGLFRMEPAAPGMPARWVALKGINTQVWQLLEARGTLLAATTAGLMELHNDQPHLLTVGGQNVNAFTLLQENDDRVLVGLATGLGIATFDGRHWAVPGMIPGVEMPVRRITPAEDGILWLGDGQQTLLQLNLNTPEPSVTPITPEMGFSDPNALVFRLRGQTLLAGTFGLRRWDATARRFNPDASFGKEYADSTHAVAFLYPEPSGERIWLRAGANRPDADVELMIATPGPQNTFRVKRSELTRLNYFATRFIYPDPTSEANPPVVWIGGDDGIIRYNPELPKPWKAAFTTAVLGVSANDSLLFAGAGFPGDSTGIAFQETFPELLYADNNLTFTFGALSFDLLDDGKGNLYRWRLVGFEDDWSAWDTRTERGYTNLPEGEYTFKVQARNIYGQESEVGEYSFVILPPWYRTWWAYTLYVLLAVGLVYLFVRWRLAQLEAEKRVLEQKVVERTAEVVRQKEEIQQANEEIKLKNAEIENAYEEIKATNENLESAYHEIEEKNQDIMDSITYAKRIQEAFLPQHTEIAHWLPASFVLFKPRDIVSGDFYWFSRRDPYLYLVGADCTGHGVPGAIMSVMGNSLLNQIIGEMGLREPGQMLDTLHLKVQETLRQKEAGAKTKDGMEIALLRLDPARQELIFAAANRPLLHIRNGEMLEFDGDKFPIGGAQYEDRTPFTPHTISYRPGDVFYTFSDGYGDQFGGERGKKFMVKNLKNLLFEIHQLPMDEQCQILDSRIEEWKGMRAQVDDILVIGFRL